LLLAHAGAVFAAGRVGIVHGYTVTSWSGGDALTLGPVRALAQDRNGYLWLGTDAGLIRFDGTHFTAADGFGAERLPKLSVHALLVSTDGDLWVGLGDGGGIYHLHDGHVVDGGSQPGIPGSVNALAQDASGTIWAGHDNGLERLQNGRWAAVRDNGAHMPRVVHLRVQRSTLLIGTANGLLAREASGEVTRLGAWDDTVRGSAEGTRGDLWITDPLRGFRRLHGDDGRPRALAGRGSELLLDGHGMLWLATIGQGLWRIDEHRPSSIERLTVQNGLLTNGIWSLLEDREGNLWVGTHEGLSRLTRHTMMPLEDLGVTSTVVRGVGNSMWAASTDGVIELQPGDAGEPIRRVVPLRGVRTLHLDARGRLWVATARGIGQLRGDTFSPIPVPAGLLFHRVTAITSDAEQVLWFSDAAQGLWTWDGMRLRPRDIPQELRPLRLVSLHADAHGSLWMAFEGGLLAERHADGTVRSFGAADGLQHTTINGLYPATAGLWITGDHGLTLFDGRRFVTFGREQGLPSRRANGVVEDRDGTIWVTMGDVGLARIQRAQFDRATQSRGYHAEVQVFDTSDGMAGMPTALDSRTAASDEKGRLWFVTGRGLTVVEPRIAANRPRASGTVRVEEALVDDQRLETAPDAELPSGTTRIRIDYTAVNLTAPERARFRYRLDGFDDEWRLAGSRRQAFYTNLPPRSYRFHVQAQTSDGSWEPVPATWAFSIAPRFYQTRTFAALCTLGGLLIVAAAWQVRLRQVRREFALVLAERGRLSREIHDTLLQSMVGVALKIDSIAKGRPDADPALTSVRHDIEDCIVEARQSIWDMRAGTHIEGELITALEAAGARATAGSGVRFRLVVSGTPRRCGPSIESELLRIAQEALANAVRHAQAGSVTLDLCYDTSSVTMRVVDDGSGFEAATTTATPHFGLITMRERAEHLGGQFRLTTASGAGTTIETIIPLSSRA
jgi:signal transduction histidine kinase/ligand-binding sensor domain-containing protein